ncbi:MAG TPA: hypothetical protein DD990_18855 [Cyanobacteria bacterium UBA11368]|nr:hypothetical protein [Cyanobacteria bacterium UBA11368]
MRSLGDISDGNSRKNSIKPVGLPIILSGVDTWTLNSRASSLVTADLSQKSLTLPGTFANRWV